MEQHMRAWVASALDADRPPDAYAAVAFWFDPQSPGQPEYNIGWRSRYDAAPLPVLCDMAARYLAVEPAAIRGTQRAIESLGYEPEGWEPDSVA